MSIEYQQSSDNQKTDDGKSNYESLAPIMGLLAAFGNGIFVFTSLAQGGNVSGMSEVMPVESTFDRVKLGSLSMRTLAVLSSIR